MLTELSDLQESDESVWGCAEVSFRVQTRCRESDELVERIYTFSHAPEWDEWSFTEFEERRTEYGRNVSKRNWRKSRSVKWHDQEAPTIDVPPEVTEQVEELLDIDEMTLQMPQ